MGVNAEDYGKRWMHQCGQSNFVIWVHIFKSSGSQLVKQEPTAAKTIWVNVIKYGEHGPSLNCNKGSSGRRHTVGAEQSIEAGSKLLIILGIQAQGLG